MDASKQKLVLDNLRLAKYIAERLSRRLPSGLLRWMPVPDLVAHGELGLVEAASRFMGDPKDFGKYAAWYVRKEVFRAVKEASTIRVPFYQYDRKCHRRKFDHACPRSNIEFASRACAPEAYDGDVKALPAREPPTPAGDIETLREALASDAVTSRQKKMIEMYYGQGLSLEAIGEHVGLTRERVRQVLRDALLRLREKIRRSKPRMTADARLVLRPARHPNRPYIRPENVERAAAILESIIW